MLEKYLIIPNRNNISELNQKGFNCFVLPLENFSIGYDMYFSIDEINELSNKYNIYIIINKFLHKEDLECIKNIVFSNKIKGIFIEDLSLINILDKDKIIISQNHMINNYVNINEYYKNNLKSVLVSNELTINELLTIRNNTKSTLFYTLISKNMLMYSKRSLISNYMEYYNLDKEKNKYIIKEKVSKKELIIKEESYGTVIFDNKIFCANKYINKLNCFDYFIVNLNNISETEEEIILDNINSSDLINKIECDYYFLENEIMYKVKNNE